MYFYMNVYESVSIYTFIYKYVCIYMNMFIKMYVWACIYTCIYIYIYIHVYYFILHKYSKIQSKAEQLIDINYFLNTSQSMRTNLNTYYRVDADVETEDLEILI